jgi:KaiC/GvpD/RAD55 family RecA-like ATPase/CheY-like chemotaxis protein
MQMLATSAAQGRRATLYTFDERRETVERRCESLGIPIAALIESNRLRIRAVEPLRFGPDEFADIVRRDIEADGTAFVMIDSISGYRMTIEGDNLVERIHALGRYLQNVGVNVLLIDELLDFSAFRATGAGISYLADNVIFLRYVESRVAGGIELGRAIGVLKKRLSNFEKGVHSFDITPDGVTVGERLPLTSLFLTLHCMKCRRSDRTAPSRRHSFANTENRRLLSETLAQRYDVTTVLGSDEDPSSTGPYDLCIVDGILLERNFRAFVSLRKRYETLFLPVLLLAERQNNELRAQRLWEAVDDVLYRPVERVELVSRVQALLRTRDLSLKAQKLTSLYEHERTIAQRLQDAALPRVPPVLPGLFFDAVYRPADNATRVGGDWYDALRLPDGRVVLTIGDVSGSGLDAAVTMSQVKQVLRAVAHVHSDPALMLDAAERTLADQDEQKQISVFVGVVDLVNAHLTYASAGHPPPLLRDDRGIVTALPCEGLLLGTPIRLPRRTLSCDFPVGRCSCSTPTASPKPRETLLRERSN